MYLEYHEKPFYKKYNYKAVVHACYENQSDPKWRGTVYDFKYDEIEKTQLINDWVEKNIPSDQYRKSTNADHNTIFYFSDWAPYKKFTERFDLSLAAVSLPYPNQKSAQTQKNSNHLWYNRFPIKIVVIIEDCEVRINGMYAPKANKFLLWCRENCRNEFKKSGYSGNVSFFFMDPIDAMSFKLMFADKIVSTDFPDHDQIEKSLKDRIRQAKKDLKIFKQGVVK